MFKKCIFITGLASLGIVSISARAQSFNYETQLTHNTYNSDDGTQKSASKLGIKYFPSSIESDISSPFTELAFLQHKSSYSLTVGKLKYQDSNFAESTSPVLGFGIRAIDSKIILELNFNQSERKSPLKTNQSQYYDLRDKDYEVNYGWYVRENVSLGASLGRRTTSYGAGPGLTSVNDYQKKYSGLISHSVFDL